MICGVEGPAVVTTTGCEGRVEIESEWTARKRERAAGRLCPAVERGGWPALAHVARMGFRKAES